MDLDIYFQPITIFEKEFEKDTLGFFTDFHNEQGFPDIEGAQIALFGVLESRGPKDNNFNAGPDVIRKSLYRLFHHQNEVKIIDLGNISQGASLNDTYHAVADVVQELNKKGIFSIILGGSQDLTYANYLAYEKLEQTVNLAVIDDNIDMGDEASPISNKNYLSKIILHEPNFLFNYSSIGYQTYFVSPVIKKLMEELFFDIYR